MPENKEQPPQQQPLQAKVEFVVPDPEGGLFTAYANNTQVAWTHFDIRMVFGEVVDTTANKIVVEQRAQVTISYLHAKQLMLMFSQAIAQHEAIFGEIKLPLDATSLNITHTLGSVPPGASSRK